MHVQMMVSAKTNNNTLTRLKIVSRLKVIVYGHRNMTLTLKTTNTTVARQHPTGNPLWFTNRGAGLTLYLQGLIPVWPHCPGLARSVILISNVVNVNVSNFRTRTGRHIPFTVTDLPWLV